MLLAEARRGFGTDGSGEMANRSSQLRQLPAEIFACPRCGGCLSAEQHHHECTRCRTQYGINNCIPSFTKYNNPLGEFSRPEMQRFVEIAKRDGWRTALNDHMRPKQPAVAKLVLDEKRSSFLKLLQLSGNETVLDFGCGYGGVSIQLSKTCRTVVALDGALERVEFLEIIRQQEKIANIWPAHNNDSVNLPFKDASFDLIILIGVFEYLPLGLMELPVADAQRQILAELWRILKPLGQLYLATKNRYGWQYLKGATDHNSLRFGPVWPRPLANLLSQKLNQRPYRIILDSRRGYENLLHGAGFNSVQFFWPRPGYQSPEQFVPLECTTRDQLLGPYGQQTPAARKFFLLALKNTGLLEFVVPAFAIVAHKD